MKTSFIYCHQLTKSYRKGTTTVTPLEALDLEIGEGSFTALMGPSGSGKTTLLNLIAGVDVPTSGRLTVAGFDLTGLTRSQLTQWRAEHVGYIFQLYHLMPVLTAFENVELPLLLRPMTRKERRRRVEAALEQVGLSNRMDHRPNELSGGQEQRVAIARAIVGDPPLLVADEPTGDLDRESAGQILALLRQLTRDSKKTLVMVTHDHQAAAAADRMLHLEKGNLAPTDREVVS